MGKRMKTVWEFLWSDNTKFRNSWLFWIGCFAIGCVTFYLSYCSKKSQPENQPIKDTRHCDGGKGIYFSTTLKSIALVNLDNGQQMDREAYDRSDEHNMYLENEREGKKEPDERRLLRGFDVKLVQIQDGTLMLGHDGFPVLLSRKKSRFIKYTAESIHLATKSSLKLAMSGDTEGANQLEDGIWAVKTDDSNFVALEVIGLPSTKEYPFGSPKLTNVNLNWCLYKTSWYEF